MGPGSKSISLSVLMFIKSHDVMQQYILAHDQLASYTGYEANDQYEVQ